MKRSSSLDSGAARGNLAAPVPPFNAAIAQRVVVPCHSDGAPRWRVRQLRPTRSGQDVTNS